MDVDWGGSNGTKRREGAIKETKKNGNAPGLGLYGKSSERVMPSS